jgi:hypothetical protein
MDIIISDCNVLVGIHIPGNVPIGKEYNFPTWGSPEVEDVCQNIAKRVSELQRAGVQDFRFAKHKDVSMTNLNRIAKRIAEIVGAVTESYAKHLN